MNKAFVVNVNDIRPICPDKYVKTNVWPMVNDKNGGNIYIEFNLIEIKPNGFVEKKVHEDADHVYYFISGKGYVICEGERLNISGGDALWIPRGTEHELYVNGSEILKLVAIFAPGRGTGKTKEMVRKTKCLVRNIKEVNSSKPPMHKDASSWPLILPKMGGGDSIEVFITEIRPNGAALSDIHEDADHVYFFLSGKGYANVGGERFKIGHNDAFFIPRGVEHEIFCSGEETLRYVVTYTPARLFMRPL
jgi:mannose-6-phosphate isomerase-like protein (cupin superfamily)